MCGMKDSLLSKTTPRNLVSSTTGTGVPFSSRMGSRWGLRNLQKCMHTVLDGENLNPGDKAEFNAVDFVESRPRRFGPVHTGDKVDRIGNKVDPIANKGDSDKLSNSSCC